MTKNLQVPTAPRIPAELLLRHSVPALPWQLATPSPTLSAWGMSPYRPTRREFLIGAGSLLVLAPYGCGSDGESGQGGGTRTIEHELGTTEVPRNPERVAAFSMANADALLTLGIVPVGTTDAKNGLPLWYEQAEFPVEAEPGEIENFGGAEEPNLEKLATLEPDVILGWYYEFEQNYDQLSEIAPTVGLSPTSGPEWKGAFRRVAETVGREPEYEQYLQSYERTLEELRSGLDGGPADYTVSLLWNFDQSTIFYYGDETQPGSVLLDAGFQIPDYPKDVAADPGGKFLQLSTELLPEVDADVIFVMTGEDAIPENRADYEPSFANNELWQSLEAVKNGNVFPVEVFLWANGGPAGIRDVMLPQLFSAVKEATQ